MSDAERWAIEDSSSDDGLRGPAGETFGAALHAAGAHHGFSAAYPRMVGDWVGQPWHGRGLIIRTSELGRQGRTTGYRWIAIRLATTHRLGEWVDPPMRSNSDIEGVGLPVVPAPPSARGTWAEDPQLSADLWAFAMRVAPHGHPSEQERFAILQARNDGVIWHLRASRLDAARLVEAIALLERVADHAERYDAVLTARLGRPKGVGAARRIEGAAIAIAFATIALIIGAMFVFAYAF